MKKIFKKSWFAWTCTVIVMVIGICGIVWITQHPRLLISMAAAGTFFAVNADNLAKPLVIPKMITKRTSIKKIPEAAAVAA